MFDFKSNATQENYQEILAHANEAKTPEEIYFVVSSHLSLGNGKEAMQLLLTFRKALWDWKPTLLLKANFETRFILKQFDEAYEDYSYFSNLPYVSQAVEEQLRDLPHRIRVEEVASRPEQEVDEDQMHHLLRQEKDPATLLAYLNSLKKKDLMPYIGDLHNLLEQDDVHDDVKSFALMLLSAHHDDTTVSFQKGGKKFTLIPAEVRMPYASKDYQSVRKALVSTSDVSVSEVAGELLDQYCLVLYPRNYFFPNTCLDEATAFQYLAQRYLGKKCLEVSLAARNRANEIENDLSKASPIAF